MLLRLTPYLTPSLSRHCYHLKGKGAKSCVRQLQQAVNHYRYVCRSDVDSYYASIDQTILLQQLKQHVTDEGLLALLKRALERVDDHDGLLNWQTVGLSKGSPLSPLLGALYLQEMDQSLGGYCEARGLQYYRFMDDWIVLCQTRRQLRHVVKLMNQSLAKVKQTKHPFKTYIGRIKETGFDFLGYRFTPNRALTPAWATIAKHRSKLLRLYEQGASLQRVAEYVKRWVIWVNSGVNQVVMNSELDLVCEIFNGRVLVNDVSALLNLIR
ncbi:hypothetical protein F9817_06820 [Vibrio sp. CAIM 722]|uniref:Reverse transcriptase domain-containing protein n=1 Tax=Vibrio eleionomae TaxID=2653505 RepID=A0A7X4LJS3_9VIBR|nr:hypothetical protein [Vibrio eleionomae]